MRALCRVVTRLVAVTSTGSDVVACPVAHASGSLPSANTESAWPSSGGLEDGTIDGTAVVPLDSDDSDDTDDTDDDTDTDDNVGVYPPLLP